MTSDYWVEAASEGPSPPDPGKRRWGRRLIALLLLAIVVVAGVFSWRSAIGPARGDVLNVGSQRGGTKAVMLASHVLDGAPYRVAWAEFPAAQNLLEAIGAGAVDVGVAGDAPFQFAYQSGQPVEAVGALAARPRPPGALDIVVPGSSPIRDVAGLRGKKIATTRGSIGHYLILRVLEANGLKPDDVKITFLSPGDTKAAFDTGSIDAWATWSPYVPTALAGGARIVADGATYSSGYAFDVANARSAGNKRAILADFLHREAQAYAWAAAHPRDYARVLADETGLPFDIALYHVQHQSLARVSITGALKAEERDVVGHFRTAGLLKSDRPAEDAFLQLDPAPAQ